MREGLSTTSIAEGASGTCTRDIGIVALLFSTAQYVGIHFTSNILLQCFFIVNLSLCSPSSLSSYPPLISSLSPPPTIFITHQIPCPLSINEVDAEEVQNHASKDEVRECSVSKHVSRSPQWYVCIPHRSLVGQPYLSCEIFSKSALFAGLVCMRRLAVRTNCPTVAPKPERKALKG